MYKYSLDFDAIPYLSYNVCSIIKSIAGKNKKVLVLDLDNTLWGGVVGDDGVGGIEIGNETSMGQVYRDFQSYIKSLKDLGVILCVCSKNDHENAIAGLNHPDGVLKSEDFIIIKANWDRKDINIQEIAKELNVFEDSLVFLDDNPVERDIVSSNLTSVAVPIMDHVEDYIMVVDKSGFFEMTNFSGDDVKRNDMYKANTKRANQQKAFENYDDYLESLDMKGYIKAFDDIYLQRITQLTNKSNQFNLTTRRFTKPEIEKISIDDAFITLYGKLTDKFGDNGIVSVVIGKKDERILHIDLWLMSCRVLKRNFEHAMLDRLVEEAKKQEIETIKGYYYKTAKNAMVKEFYATMGFEKTAQNQEDTIWQLDVASYKKSNNIIAVSSKLEDKK